MNSTRPWSLTVRQPAATRFQVGSTPTGVSDRSTAGSDYST